MVQAAFVPAVSGGVQFSTRAARARTNGRTAPTMVVPTPVRRAAARLAALPATLAVTLPAMASEGTGEGLGIDNALLYIPLILIPGVMFILFAQFGSQQDNSDFMGGYDDRRN